MPGTPKAPERWPESSRTVEGSLELKNGGLRALEEPWDDFLLEAFSCQVWSFSVLLWRLQVAPGGVELCPRRSLDLRGSPELQNGGLRALEEAWDDFLLETFPGHLALLERVLEVLAGTAPSFSQLCGLFP